MVLMTTVEDFLERGKLLSPDVVEDIDSLDDEAKEKLFEKDGLVIRRKDFEDVNRPKPRIVVNNHEGREELHVSDFTEFYLERFEFLKDEVRNRLDGEEISSINNVSSGKTSVIGMVRKVDDGKVLLEDKTGELILKTDKKFLEDEVVGVKGRVIRNEDVTMSPEKIIYPDVPLSKEVRTLDDDLKALFVSEVNEKIENLVEEKEIDYVFSTSKDSPDNVVHISNEAGELSDIDPVRCDLGELRILIHNGDSVKKAEDSLDLDRREALISILKRRHLDPIEMHSLNDRYLLRKVPDIVHVSDDEGISVNYKGVTLVSTTENRAYIINLKTRDVEEVEL